MDLLRRSRRHLLVLGAVAVLAAAFAVPALAQNARDTETPGEAATADDAPRGERFADARDAFVEELAAELDLPVERVDAALTAVRERLAEQHRDERRAALEERLDEAVANGDVSREQADAIVEAAEAGVLGRGHGRRGFGHHDPHGGWFGRGEAPPAATPGDTSLGDRA